MGASKPRSLMANEFCTSTELRGWEIKSMHLVCQKSSCIISKEPSPYLHSKAK